MNFNSYSNFSFFLYHNIEYHVVIDLELYSVTLKLHKILIMF